MRMRVFSSSYTKSDNQIITYDDLSSRCKSVFVRMHNINGSETAMNY